MAIEAPPKPAAGPRGRPAVEAAPERDDLGPGHAAPAAPPRVLRRPRDDRMVFGVAGGLGRYLGVDPVLVRVAFVALAVLGGSGVLLYLAGLVLIPEEVPGEWAERPGDHRVPPPGAGAGSGPALVIGGGLVVIGAVSLASRLVPSVEGLVGPVILVGLGVLLLLTGGRR